MAHTTSIYGDSEGWNIAYYVFTGCRGFLFFVVVILLATGGCVGGWVSAWVGGRVGGRVAPSCRAVACWLLDFLLVLLP